jgi:asparagine synthase (glutamine-hydrolysing)
MMEPSATSADLPRLVRGMTAALAHRGPDGADDWVDPAAGLALGHRRLAVIDLSPGGNQPRVSANGRYVVTYNGEIYNHRDLRAALAQSGIICHSRSDVEVLVEACALWGVEATAKRLSGMFAFALWDREERALSLVRDPLGVKPLYWGRVGTALLFGSELKALATYPGWAPEIDRDALAAYFRHNYVPAPRTVYRGIFKLEPGHQLVFRRGQAERMRHYWDAEALAGDAARLSDGEATDRLEALLRDAVGAQMMADVPLGAFLSGGIDSSTVVALMQAQSTRRVKTFTLGFRAAGYDEAPAARAVAAHLGTEHTELYVGADEARRLIPRIADWFDEPFADSSQIPTYLVAEMTRRHVTVALSGDGGDEVFGGYNRYRLAAGLSRGLRLFPLPLRSATAAALSALPPAAWDALSRAIPARWRPRQSGDKLHKIAAILTLRDEDAIYRRLVSQWQDPERLVIGAREHGGALWNGTLAKSIPDFLARMQYLDLVTYLPDDILTKVDRTSMAVSLEARVPLLDPRVVTFGAQLRPRQKIRRGRGKWLLRQVLYRYVPPSLVERPKTGFGIPLDEWLRGPLRCWAEDLLSEARLRSDGLLDPSLVRMAWQDHLSGRRNTHYPLWCVLMFQEWQSRWLGARGAQGQSP